MRTLCFTDPAETDPADSGVGSGRTVHHGLPGQVQRQEDEKVSVLFVLIVLLPHGVPGTVAGLFQERPWDLWILCLSPFGAIVTGLV